MEVLLYMVEILILTCRNEDCDTEVVKGANGVVPYCKDCKIEANRVKSTLWKERNNYHQILPELEYQVMLICQGGQCAGCGQVKELEVDHDHNCCRPRFSCSKCRRGLLCKSCNLGLGLLKDNPETLRSLIKYLEDSSNV